MEGVHSEQRLSSLLHRSASIHDSDEILQIGIKTEVFLEHDKSKADTVQCKGGEKSKMAAINRKCMLVKRISDQLAHRPNNLEYVIRSHLLR